MTKLSALSGSIGILMLGSLACRPVIAIGWTELFVILILLVVLFTPLFLRLFRLIARNRHTKSEDQQ